ncbi:MAG: hypothetical protein IJT41_10530 [Clostridia bacterium]|nr:hypothetical protein [Clostridia bacterium]
MKYVWIAVILICLVVFFVFARKRKARPEEDDSPIDRGAQQKIAADSEAYLRSHINDQMTFSEMTDVFEQMCKTPAQGELILFEAGTYAFFGKPEFSVSLVRQIFGGEDDEFLQIHLDLYFAPDAENSAIFESEWLDVSQADYLQYVRVSDAAEYADSHTPMRVDIHTEET